MALHFLIHLIAQAQTAVVHREQKALNLQGGIELTLDDLHRIEQFGYAL